MPTLAERCAGCLIGTALGDSLLLPAEGLSRSRVARRFPGPLRQRLVFGRGMVSDDTEHAFLTTQALLVAGDDADRFARALAFRLRWWLVCLPGGCGMATARGLLKSWIGFPPSRSGVHSAGNGPAMRSAIIGLRWADDPVQMQQFVRASTRITHTDERAYLTAMAVALAASETTRSGDLDHLFSAWRSLSERPDWQRIVDILQSAIAQAADVDSVARSLDCPEYVSGYAYHSVPLALYTWLRHRDDPEACLSALLRCGGDTDTMGAIAGALLGAGHGSGCFPAGWMERLTDWPMSPGRLRAAGRAMGETIGRPIGWIWPLQPLRNLVFLTVILAHGVGRLLP